MERPCPPAKEYWNWALDMSLTAIRFFVETLLTCRSLLRLRLVHSSLRMVVPRLHREQAVSLPE
jgi:hypothetical protein